MVIFIWDESRILVTTSSIRRALTLAGWSKKSIRQRANEQNAELREFYLHNILKFESYHLVYVDESGCDKRIGLRRTSWSPLGVVPVQPSQFHRDERYQIPPAYAQDGIVLSRIFRGSTDAGVFEDFFEQLLRHCGRWPESKSFWSWITLRFTTLNVLRRYVLMLESSSFTYLFIDRVLIQYEEFFAELENFIRRSWCYYEENANQGFDHFPDWCIKAVGAKRENAEGHFRHADLTIEYLECHPD